MAIATPTAVGQSLKIGNQKYVSVADSNRFVFIKDDSVSPQDAPITPLYDPLPAPNPIVPVATLNGATLIANKVGSVMVNGGKCHSFGRLSTPPAPNSWNGTLTISPTTGNCKVRWGITTGLQGTTEVSIDGATPITATNIGFGWSGATSALSVFTDGSYTWFEVPVTVGANPVSVKVTTPTGLGLLPCVYAADAITSLKPANPTGLILRAMPGGETMDYRPSAFVKPAELPKPFDSTALNNRIADVEYGMSFVSSAIVAFSSELNVSSQLNAIHPAGGTYQEFVTQNQGCAIDLTLGSNVTAATLKIELGVPATDTLIRVKSGTADSIIANASLIPNGLYRLWYAGGQIRIRVLDSST